LYTITIPGDILSTEGYPLWNHTGITWSFTTGSTYWHLDSAKVETFDGLNLRVQATGGPNQSVFIVIWGVDSFELNETSPGNYSRIVPESYFRWNEVYSYHFSDKDEGEDLAPGLAGEVRMPTGGKPPQPDPDDDYEEGPDPLGCLLCCGISLVVILVIVGVVLLLSKIKSHYDDLEE
jgi:hypothetical protein